MKSLTMPKSNNRWVWILLACIFGIYLLSRIGSVFSEDGISYGDKVGIVRLEGLITDSEKIIDNIEKLRKREDVRSIVLRIDSPGGSVAPSQEIYEKVKQTNMEKPVVASIGTVGASGGYYAALESETIIVNRGSIVGSIGVILEYPVAVDLLENIGLKFETIKSGNVKDSGSPTREVTKEDRETFRSVVLNLHDQFKRAVADGRKLDVELVNTLADGRVFTGEQSIELGLADTLGTLEDAIRIAAQLGNIAGDPVTVEARKEQPSIIDFLFGEVDEQIESWFGLQPAYRWR